MKNIINMFSSKLNETVGKSLYSIKDELCAQKKDDELYTDFCPSFMPYKESRPNYEKGFEKYVKNVEETQKPPVIDITPETQPKSETVTKPEPVSKTETKTETKTPSKPEEAEKTETISLEKTLSDFSKSIDNTVSRDYKKNNENVLTASELYMNIEKMLASSNTEIAGIGKSLSDLFKELGIELWKVSSNDPNELAAKYDDYSDSVFSNIVAQTIIAAIKGDELDPADDGTSVLAEIGKQTGVTIDELTALDKNGDGSIVEELSALLKNPEFISTCKFKVQRQNNKTENKKNISRLDSEKGGNGDGRITEAEIKAQFGQNEIADLFKTSSGSVDRSLLLVLGAAKQKDGTYTISVSALKNKIYMMDTNRDGKITKEEVEKFKSTDYFKQVLNFYL